MSRAIEIPAELRGELVRLRPLQERDLAPFVAAYAEDPDLGPAAGMEHDPSEESLRERLAAQPSGAAEGRFVELAVTEAGDDRLAGTVVLHSIDWRHQHAEAGFWFGREFRGRGLATEAVGLIVDWAFAELGMHRVEMITITSLPHCERVVALAERLGFRPEGILRGRNFERGRRLDALMLAVLRDERM